MNFVIQKKIEKKQLFFQNIITQLEVDPRGAISWEQKLLHPFRLDIKDQEGLGQWTINHNTMATITMTMDNRTQHNGHYLIKNNEQKYKNHAIMKLRVI